MSRVPYWIKRTGLYCFYCSQIPKHYKLSLLFMFLIKDALLLPVVKYQNITNLTCFVYLILIKDAREKLDFVIFFLWSVQSNLHAMIQSALGLCERNGCCSKLTLEFRIKCVYILSIIKASTTIMVHCTVFIHINIF